jgi:hypothetical protein
MIMYLRSKLNNIFPIQPLTFPGAIFSVLSLQLTRSLVALVLKEDLAHI